jgi:hypothetical protein
LALGVRCLAFRVQQVGRDVPYIVHGRPARVSAEDHGRDAHVTMFGGASPSYGVCQAAEQRVSGFSSFVEQRSCHFFWGERMLSVWITLDNVSSWSSLSVARLDKAASYSACQGGQRMMPDTHRSRGTSAPNLPTGSAPKGEHGCAPLQSRKGLSF